MKNLNEEIEDFIKNGNGNRSNDQIIFLSSFRELLSDLSINGLFRITDDMEKAYNKI